MPTAGHPFVEFCDDPKLSPQPDKVSSRTRITLRREPNWPRSRSEQTQIDDEAIKAYRVRPGFKFPELGSVSEPQFVQQDPDREQLKKLSRKLLADGERFLESVRALCSELEAGNELPCVKNR